MRVERCEKLQISYLQFKKYHKIYYLEIKAAA